MGRRYVYGGFVSNAGGGGFPSAAAIHSFIHLARIYRAPMCQELSGLLGFSGERKQHSCFCGARWIICLSTTISATGENIKTGGVNREAKQTAGSVT